MQMNEKKKMQKKCSKRPRADGMGYLCLFAPLVLVRFLVPGAFSIQHSAILSTSAQKLRTRRRPVRKKIENKNREQ